MNKATHKNNCLICERISQIKEGRNPYFVAELKTGYVVLGDYQFFKGYALFLCKKHVSELHELTKKEKILFLKEMSVVAEAVFKSFRPDKLNYELLGNKDRHLHWHIFPRHSNDLRPSEPVWRIDKSIRRAEKYKPSPADLLRLKKILLSNLRRLRRNSNH